MDGNSSPIDAPIPNRAETVPLETVQNPEVQSRIILAHERGLAYLEKPAAEVKVTEGERETFLQRIKTGEIDTKQIGTVLLFLDSPLSKVGQRDEVLAASHILADLNPNRQGRAIIAKFTKGSIDLRDQLRPSDIFSFFRENPLPPGFEKEAEGLLGEIELYNGPQKRAEYEVSLLKMMRAVYGERQQYWEQYKLMGANSVEKPS